jgi:hypothetical protein
MLRVDDKKELSNPPRRQENTFKDLIAGSNGTGAYTYVQYDLRGLNNGSDNISFAGSGMPRRQEGRKPGGSVRVPRDRSESRDTARSGRRPRGSRRVDRRHGGVEPERTERPDGGTGSDGETPPAGGSATDRSAPQGARPGGGTNPKEGTCQGRTETGSLRRGWQRVGAGRYRWVRRLIRSHGTETIGTGGQGNPRKGEPHRAGHTDGSGQRLVKEPT